MRRRGEMMEKGGKETIFIFQPRRRKMSGRSRDSGSINTHSVGTKNKRKRRQNKEYIYIYNIIN
jgi:hypothetical protein